MFPIDFFARAAQNWSDRVAVVDGDDELTYSQLAERARAIGAALQDLAGAERPKVALLCPNSIDLFSAIVAIHGCGAILIPLNPKNSAGELHAQIELVKPHILLVDASCLGLVNAGEAKLVVAGAAVDSEHPTLAQLIERFAGRSPAWPAVSADDDYAIKFTGGSSGRPKGVRQSFRSHVAVIVHVLLGLRWSDGEIYACAAPMTHGAGSFVLPTLAVGGKVVHGTKAGPLLDSYEQAGATATWVPPTLLYMLIDEQKQSPRSLKLRHLVFGGAPTTPERIDEGISVFGPVLETTYGQTEASTIATALSADQLADKEARYSAGARGPLVRVEVMDTDGKVLAPGTTGEIVVAGDLLMSGYLEMPEETSKTLVNGWLHTGDVGYIDEKGRLFVKDRIRDVVITGGFNVYPSDVEAAMAKHPAVRECVVFGIPDPHWGERVECALELKQGTTAPAEELVEFAKSLVGPVKAPKRVHIMAQLPRSPVGKVLRREAKALIQAQYQATANA
jgi:fatty-acyl-CoA synthase